MLKSCGSLEGMYTEAEEVRRSKISGNEEDGLMGDDDLNEKADSIHYIVAKRLCVKKSFEPSPF